MDPIRPAEPGDISGDSFGDSGGDTAEPERLDSGPPVAVPAAVRRGVLAAVIGGTALILGVALFGESLGRGTSTPGAVESPSPSASATPVNFPSPRQPTPTPTRPPVFSSSGFLADLDVVVFARSNRAVFRIDTAARQVTRTPTEGLDSTGEVSLLALDDRVLIRPWDDVNGFEVVDGRPARRLTGQLAGSGQYLPGPPGRLWTISSMITGGTMTARLTDATGRRTFAEVEVASSGALHPDGAGGLFYEQIGGTYQAEPSGLRRVTPGKVLATSRNLFLATECDERFACGTFVYDRRTGSRRRTGPADPERGSFGTSPDTRYQEMGPPGTLSPDGRYAALRFWEPTSGPSLVVIDVRSGARLASFSLEDDESFSDPSAIWLPDGRLLWLRESRLAVFDPRTKQTERSTMRMPPLIQIALRPPAG